MPPPASDEFFCLFEFESDDSVEIGPFSWILDTDKDVDPESYVDQAVEVMWVSGSKTEKYRATVLAVNRSKDNLIRKRNKMCDGQSMETDKETGRGKRKKKPTRTYMYSSSSWRRMMRSLNQKKQKCVYMCHMISNTGSNF
nr:uncharacterized protein LOC129267169 [Lytechinus pictus]